MNFNNTDQPSPEPRPEKPLTSKMTEEILIALRDNKANFGQGMTAICFAVAVSLKSWLGNDTTAQAKALAIMNEGITEALKEMIENDRPQNLN